MSQDVLRYGDHEISMNAILENGVAYRVLRKVFAHVLGNEVSSKVINEFGPAKEANGADSDAREARTREYRDAFVAQWADGTYLSGTREPGEVAPNREAVLFKRNLYKAVRDFLKAANYDKTGKDVWRNPTDGTDVGIEDWAKAYLANPASGAARKAKIDEAVQADLAAEEAERARRAEMLKMDAGTQAGASGLAI